MAREPLRKVEGGGEALARRGGHGDHAVPRQVGEHRLLGRRRGQHLVAGVLDQAGQQLGMPLVAHDETRFVMRINSGHSYRADEVPAKGSGDLSGPVRAQAALRTR